MTKNTKIKEEQIKNERIQNTANIAAAAILYNTAQGEKIVGVEKIETEYNKKNNEEIREITQQHVSILQNFIDGKENLGLDNALNAIIEHKGNKTTITAVKETCKDLKSQEKIQDRINSLNDIATQFQEKEKAEQTGKDAMQEKEKAEQTGKDAMQEKEKAEQTGKDAMQQKARLKIMQDIEEITGELNKKKLNQKLNLSEEGYAVFKPSHNFKKKSNGPSI